MSEPRERTQQRKQSLTLNQFQLVKLVDAMGDDAYLNAIFREVNKGREKLVDLGAIHITLNRLRKAGVLETFKRETSGFADGRLRRLVIYRMTRLGRSLYKATREQFKEVIR